MFGTVVDPIQFVSYRFAKQGKSSFPFGSHALLEGAQSGQGEQIETARAARVNQTGLRWEAKSTNFSCRGNETCSVVAEREAR
jgi:hypothetical protein